MSFVRARSHFAETNEKKYYVIAKHSLIQTALSVHIERHLPNEKLLI